MVRKCRNCYMQSPEELLHITNIPAFDWKFIQCVGWKINVGLMLRVLQRHNTVLVKTLSENKRYLVVCFARYSSLTHKIVLFCHQSHCVSRIYSHFILSNGSVRLFIPRFEPQNSQKEEKKKKKTDKQFVRWSEPYLSSSFSINQKPDCANEKRQKVQRENQICPSEMNFRLCVWKNCNMFSGFFLLFKKHQLTIEGKVTTNWTEVTLLGKYKNLKENGEIRRVNRRTWKVHIMVKASFITTLQGYRM